jgi:hypothetical protein
MQRIMTSHANKRRAVRTSFSCAIYYSDGAFHASGLTKNLTNHGGCLSGTHAVTVGMEIMVLLIPRAKHALMIKKATVRWVNRSHFGVQLDEADCGAIGEIGEPNFNPRQRPTSILTH